MSDESILKYSNDVLLKDTIAIIFKTHMKAYGIEDFTDNDLEYIVNRFSSIYKNYIIDSFKELDIQTVYINGKNYVEIQELMSNVSNILASKLAIEILLLELKSKAK